MAKTILKIAFKEFSLFKFLAPLTNLYIKSGANSKIAKTKEDKTIRILLGNGEREKASVIPSNINSVLLLFFWSL
jgi:hypothetical protein